MSTPFEMFFQVIHARPSAHGDAKERQGILLPAILLIEWLPARLPSKAASSPWQKSVRCKFARNLRERLARNRALGELFVRATGIRPKRILR